MTMGSKSAEAGLGGAEPNDTLFAGPGEMRALCRAFDWAASPLGCPAGWPATLRSLVGIVLAAHQPMILWWGPELVQIYNDSYRPSLGTDRHPQGLGARAREFWRDAWPVVGPEIEGILRGGPATWHRDRLVPIVRDGVLQDVYWTYGYTPVRDAGVVSGVLITVVDTSAQVNAQSAREAELELANAQLQDQASELEMQAEELQTMAAQLEERAEEAERTAAALEASERHLRTLVDAIPTLAWTARADGYIDWYNARWYEYTGTTPSDMEGWGWQSVHDPAVLPRVLERWTASIATGEPFEMVFPLRGADARPRQFLTRVVPVRDAAGRVVRWFGTNTDVESEHTARAAAEGANQAKTDFLTTMSHELRTPLNAIAGYAELLEMGIHGPVTDAQREAITRIQRSQRHLLSLINDVLNFAKLEAGRVEYDVADVVLCDVMDALEPLVAPQLRAKSLAFGRAECARDCAARADAEKVQQILLNVLSNAIKFTAKGGAVTMRCRVEGRVATVEIADTGIGIPPDRLGDVFAPFVQIDRRLNSTHDGAGLGLAISRDLARGMGGDLTAESAVGVGSTFTLTLPAA
ncbi:MAG TPA: HAMP domain-containing sensor histidine kinase [Gemmatimonadaceae bacterium]|nr:HAMP domain-containing sensor histidine kinase [Gemmatimonadaceae bacterium]